MAAVKWWEMSEERKRVKLKCWACFADMSKPAPAIVRYPAYVDHKVTAPELKFFTKFLLGIFPEGIAKARVVVMKGWKDCDGGNNLNYYGKKSTTPIGRWVIWELKTKGMSHHKALTYLTAMRYPHEFSEIVRKFYKNHKALRSIEKLFEAFQQIHIDEQSCSSHGLMCASSYHYVKDEKVAAPISLEQFRKNLADPMRRSVYSHFTP